MNMEEIYGAPGEKPLDRLVSDGGFVGIFRKIACVGDSLSSGEFEVYNKTTGNKMYLDRFDYSWGQYLARMSGTTVYNFSRGGMTAKEYIESFANANGYWKTELAANAYIIALGVNDLFNRGWEVGTTADVCLEDHTKNAETFIGYYAAIIQRYKEIQPEARFFLVTTPRSGRKEEIAHAHRDALYALAEMFSNTYVVDLYTYGTEYDDEFRRNFFLGGHMNPAGYLYTAKIIVSYIDYIIRHNFPDFKTVGLMGIDYDLTPKEETK